MKAALYIRVSTTYQIDKDSLPVQRQDLINYAKYAFNIDDYEILKMQDLVVKTQIDLPSRR